MGIEEEETEVRNMVKKSKKSRKIETNDLEQVGDYTGARPKAAENSFQLEAELKEKEKEKKKENKKKKKKKSDDGGDIELDSFGNEAVNGKSHLKVDSDYLKENAQKNRILQSGKEGVDCTDAEPTEVENSFKLSKKDKKMKRKNVVSGTSDDLEADGGQYQKQKTKKRRLEYHVDEEALRDETPIEGEGERSLPIQYGMDSILVSDLKSRKDKKKGKQRHIEADATEDNEVVKGDKSFKKSHGTESKNREEKKNDGMGRDNMTSEVKGQKKTKGCKEVGRSREECDEGVMEKVERKKRRRETINKADLDAGLQEIVADFLLEDKGFGDNEGSAHSTISETQDIGSENGKIGKRKKRKSRAEESGNRDSVLEDKGFEDNEGNAHSTISETQEIESENGSKSVAKGLENPKPKRKSKKVVFSDHVEVFPSHDSSNRGEENQEEFIRGKRFSQEEDEIIKEAVSNYIKQHDLGEEGEYMIVNCSKFPEVKNCWKDIGAALPDRPHTAVYYRAHVLLERGDKRKWTKEEYERILKHQKEKGNDWKSLAEELGKHRFHVKDTYRRIKLANKKKGNWSQEEYQGLFDLVNKDLQMRIDEQKRSKHGMLRDNICFSAISDKLATRNNADCCKKWYYQLRSGMVSKGIWDDVDDYRLLDALYTLDACSIEDVDWDNLLEHRSGDICRNRWNQMVLHIGHHGSKTFAEQVEILAKRYCPDLIEAREAWDSKHVVP